MSSLCLQPRFKSDWSWTSASELKSRSSGTIERWLVLLSLLLLS